MTDHLNQNELNLAVEENPQKLPREKYTHFTLCSQCLEQYNIQQMMHISLKKLKPVPAPEKISQKVLNSLISISKQAVPKKKTDWIFLLAMIILFGIGSWYLFNGKVNTILTQYAPQITPEKTELVNNSTKVFQSLKQKINSVEFNFRLTGFNWHAFYVLIGLLAFIFYTVLDKKLSQMYKMRRG
jgi:hypothetical protein